MEGLGAYLFTGAFRFLAWRFRGENSSLGDPLELLRFVWASCQALLINSSLLIGA
jgi:hypothetical protein